MIRSTALRETERKEGLPNMIHSHCISDFFFNMPSEYSTGQKLCTVLYKQVTERQHMWTVATGFCGRGHGDGS